MTPARRRLVLIALLIAAVGLVVFDRQSPQRSVIVDAVAPRAKAPAAESRTGAAREQGEGSMILPIRPRTPAAKIDDAFATRDWRPQPPPPPPKPTASPKPMAPPLPYSVIGKKLEDGAWQVFLRRDERILVVKTLDTIDDAYRVDEIRPPTMTLTYLPLQQQQALPIGGAE
jgi:hypothetical protein